MRKKFVNNYFGVLLVLAVSIFAIRAFFVSGFFPIHDDTQIARVYEMGKALKDGMIPVRWVSDLGFGYGYPIFSFYAPLAYYVGAGILFLGFNSLVATKTMMALGILLSGVTMYFLGEKLWGKLGGVYAGIFYVYATYHAVDIFVRGDVAEFWAYAFIPLTFLGVYQISHVKYNMSNIKYFLLWLGVGSVGLAGVILSHNLTAFMLIPFLFIFSLYLIFQSKVKLHTAFYILLITILALGFSAFYWLPVFPEMKYTNVLSQVGGTANYADHFVCLKQLWFSPWGYGGSTAGCVDGFSFMLGRVYVFIILLALVGLFLFWKNNKEKSRLLLLSLAFLFLSLFLTLQYAHVVWEKVPFFAFLQYPWRFLLIAAFFNSVVAGGVVAMYQRKLIAFVGKFYAMVLYVLVLGLLLYTQVKFFQPQRFSGNQENHYIQYPGIQFDASSLSHEYLPKGFAIPKTAAELPKSLFVVPNEIGSVSGEQTKTMKKEATVTLTNQAPIHISLAYFPAWHAYIDGKEAAIYKESTGVDLRVPKGKHTIALVYQSTFIESLANVISLTSVGVFVLAIIYLTINKPYGKSR